MSCGARNVEFTYAATRNREKFRAYVGLMKGADPDKDYIVHVDFSDPDAREQFMESFKGCYPDLYYDRTRLFFCCLELQARASSSGLMLVSTTRS